MSRKALSLLLDRVVSTNGIQVPNPPLTTGIFDYVAQVGECYIPFWSNIDYLYHFLPFKRISPVLGLFYG